MRPGVREGVAGVTAGTSMTAMGMEQGASTMPLEVRVDDMSQILSGAQATLPKSAVKMSLTTVLEMNEGAQEASCPSFAYVRVMTFE